MAIRRNKRQLSPPRQDSEATLRALWTEDERSTFKAYFEDAKWCSPKRAQSALADLAEQYTSYLAYVVGEPELADAYTIYLADVIGKWRDSHQYKNRDQAVEDYCPSMSSWTKVSPNVEKRPLRNV